RNCRRRSRRFLTCWRRFGGNKIQSADCLVSKWRVQYLQMEIEMLKRKTNAGRFKTTSPSYRPGESLGARYDSPLEAAMIVGAGLPFGAVAKLQKASGLTLERIKQIARISEGSFARRKQSGKLSFD